PASAAGSRAALSGDRRTCLPRNLGGWWSARSGERVGPRAHEGRDPFAIRALRIPVRIERRAEDPLQLRVLLQQLVRDYAVVDAVRAHVRAHEVLHQGDAEARLAPRDRAMPGGAVPDRQRPGFGNQREGLEGRRVQVALVRQRGPTVLVAARNEYGRPVVG